MKRRAFTVAALATLTPRVARAGRAHVIAYRNPGCVCCEGWMRAMQSSGYDVRMNDDPDWAARKRREGITPDLASCHTAYAGGYVLEGHVPPEVVTKLLRERPRIHGIALPGMPGGSPGMPGPKLDRWRVMTIELRPHLYVEV